MIYFKFYISFTLCFRKASHLVLMNSCTVGRSAPQGGILVLWSRWLLCSAWHTYTYSVAHFFLQCDAHDLTVWWDWWLAQMAQVHRPLAGGSLRTQGHQICSIQTLIQGFAGKKYLEKRRNPIWTGGSRSKAIGQDRSKDIRWDQTKGTQDLTYFLAFVKCKANVKTFVLLLNFKMYTSNRLSFCA